MASSKNLDTIGGIGYRESNHLLEYSSDACKSQAVSLGLPCGCQGPNCLGHHCRLLGTHEQEAGIQKGPRPGRSIRNVAVSGRVLTSIPKAYPSLVTLNCISLWLNKLFTMIIKTLLR